jgi:hypothetical protein
MALKSFAKILILGLFLIWLISLIRPYGGVEIKVISTSGKPVAGAAVVIGLFYNVFGPGDVSQRLVFAFEGVTDNDGTLHIPRQWVFRPSIAAGVEAWFGYWEVSPQIVIFKPGYSLKESRLANEREFEIEELSGADRLGRYRGIYVRDEILNSSRILSQMLTGQYYPLFKEK